MSWSHWLPESSESDEQEWPLSRCDINNKWPKKSGKELKIKSNSTVSPSTNGEDHFTFQPLRFISGKNVFTEHLTKQVFCPLLFNSKLCNECVSILAELGGEFAHLGWGPYDPEECGYPFTSTLKNSTDWGRSCQARAVVLGGENVFVASPF